MDLQKVVVSPRKRGSKIETKIVNQHEVGSSSSENNIELKSTSSFTTSIGDSGDINHINLGVFGAIPNPKLMDWRAKFPLPRVISPQPQMKYTPPSEVNGKILVAAQTECFYADIKDCEELVVGFFVGERLSFAAVQETVNKLWKFNKEVSIKLHGDCAFIFKFNDDEDRKKVLEIGSFYIANKLFTLRPWSYLLEKSTSDIKSVPILVLIFGVPLHMWNNDGLSLIASYLGKPILADDCTLKQDRLAYARICVEIDTEFAYPSSIPLLINGKINMDLPVEYHWKPPLCTNYMVFGHVIKNRARSGKARWIPKYTKFAQVEPIITHNGDDETVVYNVMEQNASGCNEIQNFREENGGPILGGPFCLAKETTVSGGSDSITVNVGRGLVKEKNGGSGNIVTMVSSTGDHTPMGLGDNIVNNGNGAVNGNVRWNATVNGKAVNGVVNGKPVTFLGQSSSCVQKKNVGSVNKPTDSGDRKVEEVVKPTEATDGSSAVTTEVRNSENGDPGGL